MKKRVEFFPELAGLRALAALFVCFYHFLQFVPPLPLTVNPFLREVVGFVTCDFITVDVFFVLSGFLITSFLLRDQKAPHLFNNFYWRRALRIVPVFLLALAAFRYAVPHSGAYIVLCLLLVANFSVRFGVQMASPIWTLCIEEQFYLLWPQAVRRCTPKTIGWLAFSLAVFSTVLRPLVLLFHHGAMNEFYTFYRLDGLGLGAVAACAYMAPEHIGNGLTRILRVLENPILLWVAATGLFIVPMLPLFLFQTTLSISFTNFLTFRFVWAVMNGRTFRLMTGRPLLFIASISYGLYMYHEFVILFVASRFGAPSMLHPWGLVARGALVFSLSIAVATVSLYAIEKPAQHLRPHVLRSPANMHEALVTQTHPEKADVVPAQIKTGSRASSSTIS